MNTRASLDHHGVMEDFSSLAPGVVTGGNVRVGEGSTPRLNGSPYTMVCSITGFCDRSGKGSVSDRRRNVKYVE